jgi:hypothetical protein
MNQSSLCGAIGLCFLLFALLGCAGMAVEPQGSSPQPAAVAPPPPIPDDSEMIRSKAKEMLLGKWRRQAQGDDTIEFSDDGTVTFHSAVEKVDYPGSYRILDRDQIEITMKKGGTLTWGYAVTQGELTLTTPTGVDMKYRRTRGK